MNMYLDRVRIAFVILFFCSLLFDMICTFANGWSVFRSGSAVDNFGLFSPDISSDNVCGRVLLKDASCLTWFRGTQACMLLGLLSHIVTVVGIILAEKRDMTWKISGVGQLLVATFSILALILYAFQSPYATHITEFDLGWSYKLAWTVPLFGMVSGIIGLTDGTEGQILKM